MSFLNNSPTYTFKRKGDATDPFTSITETLRVDNSKAILREIPNRFDRVLVKDSLNNNMFEVGSKVGLSANQFYVDYTHGVVSFSSSKNSERLTFTYKGIGAISVTSDRIYVENDSKTAVESLDGLVVESGDSQTSSKALLQAKITDATSKIAQVEVAKQNLLTEKNIVTTKNDSVVANINYAKAEKEKIKNIPLTPVANFSAIATAYPSPSVGFKVQTTDDGKFYRWDGLIWKHVETLNNAVLTEVQTQLSKANRASTVLSTGTSIVNGGVNDIADVEIEGRTQYSLGNSNLEAGKQYVLADKKTKIVTDLVTQTGVTKFTKGQTTVSTANFVGKVTGSTVANPHRFKYANTGVESSTLMNPVSGVEFEQARVDAIKTVNLDVAFHGRTPSGEYAQHLFSFDIVQEIERKLGIIPKATIAEKVLWIKENVSSFSTNWHGLGSSSTGNKASLRWWIGSWLGLDIEGAWMHTKGVVTKISTGATNGATGWFSDSIDANGFIHILVYAEASDGVTASSISTDYIDLVITLKSTAQLNTRATIIRVENFEGKVSGSVVENPHVMRYGNTEPLNPPSTYTEDNLGYPHITTINGAYKSQSSVGTGRGQQVFSFSIIDTVERNIGKIPRASVADKALWLNENLKAISSNWHGFGSSVGGNKANFSMWRADTLSWYAPVAHTNPTVTSQRFTTIFPSVFMDSSGFTHLIAYSEPSDGVTPSLIYTDYIDFEIELKPTADFTKPRLPLYEVPATEYNKILIDWNEEEVLRRYPAVEGVQHLQGIGIVNEGENLLPPLQEVPLVSGFRSTGVNSVMMNSTSIGQQLTIKIPALPLTDYSFSVGELGQRLVYILGNKKDGTSFSLTTLLANETFKTFKTPADIVDMTFFPSSIGAGLNVDIPITNLMLNFGTTAKPFVQQKKSYLYTSDIKLGQIGDKRDILTKQDGQWLVNKAVEKDIVLGGSLDWSGVTNVSLGNSSVKIPLLPNIVGMIKSNSLLTNHLGESLGMIMVAVEDRIGYRQTNGDLYFYINIPREHTGFGMNMGINITDVKAFFYGWKMNNGTFGVNYESNGTKTWIPIGDTSNARAVTAVPSSASPTQLDGTIQPYKLSYVLATPQTINVTDKVEGDLKVNGATQSEVMSGIVVREKVTPYVYGNGNVYLNDASIGKPTQLFKNKSLKILGIYKNGIKDNMWWIAELYANGKQRAEIKESNYDPTALYEVTYIVLEKEKLTTNPTNIKLTYATNIRSSLDDLIISTQDASNQISINGSILLALLVRLKARELR